MDEQRNKESSTREEPLPKRYDPKKRGMGGQEYGSEGPDQRGKSKSVA